MKIMYKGMWVVLVPEFLSISHRQKVACPLLNRYKYNNFYFFFEILLQQERFPKRVSII